MAILVLVLVAEIGFWDTLAILGAVGVVILLVLILTALIGVGACYVVRRVGSRVQCKCMGARTGTFRPRNPAAMRVFSRHLRV